MYVSCPSVRRLLLTARSAHLSEAITLEKAAEFPLHVCLRDGKPETRSGFRISFFDSLADAIADSKRARCPETGGTAAFFFDPFGFAMSDHRDAVFFCHHPDQAE
jgi:hypothetical protein